MALASGMYIAELQNKSSLRAKLSVGVAIQLHKIFAYMSACVQEETKVAYQANF